MSLFRMLARVIEYLLQILSKLKVIINNQGIIISGEQRIMTQLATIQVTQAEQEAKLNQILAEIVPPQPGVAVSLEFVFGELTSQQ